jgi:hypothetical protein
VCVGERVSECRGGESVGGGRVCECVIECVIECVSVCERESECVS